MSEFVENWHLDKKFALTIIFAILVDVAGGIWEASSLNSMLLEDHKTLSLVIEWKEKQADNNSKTDSHIAVIDEKLNEQSESLHHIIQILEKGDDNGRTTNYRNGSRN